MYVQAASMMAPLHQYKESYWKSPLPVLALLHGRLLCAQLMDTNRIIRIVHVH